MLDLQTEFNVHRLPIVATHEGVECILNVPQLDRATGRAIADVIYETLEKYNLLDEVEAVCFETENTNTGEKNGAAACLEKRLGRKLIWLPCRHHIFELIGKDIFIVKVMNNETKEPNVEIFKRLKNSWKSIDKTKFEPGTEDLIVAMCISDEICDEIVNFCLEHLEKGYRDDYRELLELVVIFLGRHIPGGNRLRKPSAMHHARWLSKAIYSLKIFILREQFEFKEGELDGIRDVCIFVVRLYVKAWFSCTSAINAARHDLNFIKNAIDYSSIDAQVSEIILKKFSNHLWYLFVLPIGAAFFDRNISIDELKKMVLALRKKKQIPRPLKIDPKNLKREFKKKTYMTLFHPKQWNFSNVSTFPPSFCPPIHLNGHRERISKKGFKYVKHFMW